MPSHPSRTEPALFRQLLSDYGMLFVLLLLMVVFSVLTIRVQRPTGAEAGQQVADFVMRRFGTSANVFIAVPGGIDDRIFAAAVQRQLTDSGVRVVGIAAGSPGDARRQLEQLFAAESRLDAIAVTGVSKGWTVFRRFPQLKEDTFAAPVPYRWPDFLKRTNLIGVANQTAIYAVIAIGMTMVIITAGIDLSVGSLVALSSVTATVMIRETGGTAATVPTVVMACVAGIAVAALAGVFNGLMITVASLPAFIVTLAMMLIARGLAMRFSEFQSINAVPRAFQWLGAGTSGGIPNPILIMITLYTIAHIVMARSVFGRVLYAIGGNAEAARLCGIRVRRTRMIVYTISGALAGLGGIMVSSRLNAGDPKYGDMYELEVIAAAVVGGTSLMGGEGRMLGTLIGAFIIAVIRNGMNLMSVESSNQKVVLGAVLLGAVLLDRMKRGHFLKGGI